MRNKKSNISKKFFIGAAKLPWKFFYVSALVFLVFMLVFYIFQVNRLTQGAFLIKNYNKDLKALNSENRDLQAKLAESSFLGEIANKAYQLGFEKTSHITYIKILQSSLVQFPKDY